MKKNLIWMVSLLLAVAVTFGASRLSAQNKEKKPASPRTRIAFINLTYVIKNYEKYQQFLVETKEIIEPFQKRDTELRAQLEDLHKQAKDPSLIPVGGDNRDEKEKKEELEDKAKKIKRDLEDKARKVQREVEENSEAVKKKLGKRSNEVMKSLFMDVEKVTQSYATSHELDLVLHYNDAITQEDLHSSKNITRKLNTSALMPVYWDPRMDISQDIVAVLNRKARDD